MGKCENKPQIIKLWSPSFALLQKTPRPHHWRLRNLMQLAERVAFTCGYQNPMDFIKNENVSHHRVQHLLKVALVAQLMCNVCSIRKSQKQRAPRCLGLQFIRSPYSGWLQGLPYIGTCVERSDASLFICFRGTATLHENWLDLESLWTKTNGYVLKNMKSAFDQSSPKRPSIATQIVRIAKGYQNIIVCGHSLGAAWAALTAEILAALKKDIILVTWGGACINTRTFCQQKLFMNHVKSFNVINFCDVVPFLHTMRESTCHCCHVIALNAVPHAHANILQRMLTHDILFYGYVLLLLGSQLPPCPLSGYQSAFCDSLAKCLIQIQPDVSFVDLMNHISRATVRSETAPVSLRCD